jgi:hypothetical protein
MNETANQSISNQNWKCPNCVRYFSNQRSLKIHLPSCRRIYHAAVDTHPHMKHHPLRSSLDFNNVGCDNNDSDGENSDISEMFLAQEPLKCVDDYDMNADQFLNEYENTQGQQSTAVSKLQIKLNHLINIHKAPIKLYDDIVHLLNEYMSSENFDKYARLKCRKSFIKSNEATYNVTHLRPRPVSVMLTDDTTVTVPVFDAKSMILDLVTNPDTMNENNFAPGYNIFTGDVDESPENQCYGEVHTGDQWLKAKNTYCSNRDKMDHEMPIALIIFGDKSHTDLHGSLSVTPIIFTLTLFNRAARNNKDFWRPLAYIPNLSYGKNKADKRDTKDKIQDEHLCLAKALHSIKQIYRRGGFYATVMGRVVKLKVWIHYIIGDTEGNNKWVGHYPGNKKQISRPYRDCHCGYDELKNPNPSCVYATLDNMREAKRVKLNNYNEGLALLKSMSRYDIKNAFISKHLPLSDNEHGPYGMMPPEMLHVSGQGLIKYMFESLSIQIGSGQDRDYIDKLHVQIYMNIKRQSERDFPRGSIRNGIIDGTKCQAEERKGNLFLLLVMAHTVEGTTKLQKGLGYHSNARWKRFLEFLKLYLSMEEWFHDCNRKEEVRQSRIMISKVLEMLQDIFPREEGTNGYCIPKMHAMTKVMVYMQRYGSAMNFYGGTGESAHKFFVKAPGLKTQRRVNEFAVQIAKQYYDIMVTQYALRSVNAKEDWVGLLPTKEKMNKSEDVSIHLSGKYSVVITNDVLRSMRVGNSICVNWHSDQQGIRINDNKYCLEERLVMFLSRKFDSMDAREFKNGYCFEGYTRVTLRSGAGTTLLLYAHPCFQGKEWYDWVYVHFSEKNAAGDAVESYYPAKLLGFIKVNNITEAVIHCTEKPVNWSAIEENFVVKTKLGSRFDVSIVSVPISSLVHPLCAIPDYGSDSLSYIIVLPKRNWSRYFGNKIEL